MSMIVVRPVRGFRGLGAVRQSGGAPVMITQSSTAAVAPMSFPSEWTLNQPARGGAPEVSLNPGASHTTAEHAAMNAAREQAESPDEETYQSALFVLEAEGETVEENRSPAPPGSYDPGSQGRSSEGIDWKVWAPVGLVAVGLVTAVWILRS